MSENGEKIVSDTLQATKKSLQELEVAEKKPKQRKAQTEEAFLEQKAQFESTGPQINTEDWLNDENKLAHLDPEQKFDRVHILHACEKAYFMQEYDHCLALIKTGEKLFGVDLGNENTNDDLKTDFQNAGRKTKKSTKVERHVVELLHIKEACLKKLKQSETL